MKQILENWKTVVEPEKCISPIGKMMLQAEDMKVTTNVDINGIEPEFQFNGLLASKSPPEY